jgi:hypothetical protein
MITLQQAKKLRHGQVILNPALPNADGTPSRWKVTGKIKLWARDPEKFRVPLKHGLYEHWELIPENANEFFLNERHISAEKV